MILFYQKKKILPTKNTINYNKLKRCFKNTNCGIIFSKKSYLENTFFDYLNITNKNTQSQQHSDRTLPC